MFDTFELKDITCPKCNKEINEVQTKNLECLLQYYRPGDFIIDNDISKVTFKEQLYCDGCNDFIEQDVYIHIKKGVYIGHTNEDIKLKCSNKQLFQLIKQRKFQIQEKLSESIRTLSKVKQLHTFIQDKKSNSNFKNNKFIKMWLDLEDNELNYELGLSKILEYF